MKKVIILLLSALMCFGLIACENNHNTLISDYTWVMVSIQSVEQNGDFIAYAPSNDNFDKATYPNAVPLDMICNAKDGSFSISDKTNNKTYTGTYKATDGSSKTTIYEIIIGEKSGTAVVSVTDYQDGTTAPTMIISVDDYALNFIKM